MKDLIVRFDRDELRAILDIFFPYLKMINESKLKELDLIRKVNKSPNAFILYYHWKDGKYLLMELENYITQRLEASNENRIVLRFNYHELVIFWSYLTNIDYHSNITPWLWKVLEEKKKEMVYLLETS